MSSDLNITLDHLRSGKIQKFNDHIDQDFLEISNEDISFCSKLNIVGQAYLADNFLIMNLSLKIDCLIPCKICNIGQKHTINISNFYHSTSLDEIDNQVFNPLDVIKEVILAEAPNLCECNDNNCPERKHIKKYLKNGENDGSTKK